VTFPDGLPLTDWELDNVLDYLQLKDSMDEPDNLPSVAAAFVKTGHGLYKPYTDIHCCEVEDYLNFLDEKARTLDLMMSHDM
jgi:hypothetical protein